MGDPFKEWNPLHFFVGWLIYVITIGLWWHEFCHLITLQAFGGNGHVINIGFAFAMEWTTPLAHAWQETIVAFMGGYGAALTCLILWAIDNDPEDRVNLHAIGWMNALYGTVEGLLFAMNRYDLIWWVGAAAQITGVLYAFSKSKKMWGG